MPLLWGHAVSLLDIVLAAVFYVVTGFGVTVGYHRLFTHRSFNAVRWLKILLASTGSMAVEGSVDRLGRDPSPPSRVQRQARRSALAARIRTGTRPRSSAGSCTRTSVGCSRPTPPPRERYAPDLLADADTMIISRLFPIFAVASLAAPFFLGWTITGIAQRRASPRSCGPASRAMMLLHHVTWSVNSICHMFGKPARDAEGREHQLRAARHHLVR